MTWLFNEYYRMIHIKQTLVDWALDRSDLYIIDKLLIGYIECYN